MRYLSKELQKNILSLHAVGISQREIARRLKIPRRDVRKIVLGGEIVSEKEPLDENSPIPDEFYVRCACCGHKVLPPCLACSLKYRKNRSLREIIEDALPLELNLRKRELQRYLEIKKTE